MNVPNNKHFIFLFYSRWRYLKTSNSDRRRFFNNINTIHLELFFFLKNWDSRRVSYGIYIKRGGGVTWYLQERGVTWGGGGYMGGGG